MAIYVARGCYCRPVDLRMASLQIGWKTARSLGYDFQRSDDGVNRLAVASKVLKIQLTDKVEIALMFSTMSRSPV